MNQDSEFGDEAPGVLEALQAENEQLRRLLTEVRNGSYAQEWHDREVLLLHLINDTPQPEDMLDEALALLRQWFGCEAGAIRWRQGEGFPCLASVGFPPEHQCSTTDLCRRDETGALIYDENEQALLECVCGLVLSGKVDYKQSFYSDGGSFWTNSVSALVASGVPLGIDGEPRGHCIRADFESVALIPMRFGERITGFVQLAGYSPNRFTPDSLYFLERLSSSLAVRLAHSEAQRQGHELRAQLVAERNLLESIVESFPGAFIVAVPPGLRVLYSNSFHRQFSPQYAQPGTDPLAEPHEVLFYPDGRLVPLPEWPMVQALEQGTVTLGREYLHRRDDALIPIRLYCSPVLNDRREAIATVLSFFDISSEKAGDSEREALRQEAEARGAELEAIFSALTDAVMVIDTEGRIVRANPAAQDEYRLRENELASDVVARIRTRLPNGEIAAWEDLPTARALRGEQVLNCHLVHDDAAGRRRHALSSSAPLRITGHIAGAVTIRHDVTAFMEARRELEESERRHRATGDLIPWGTFVTDAGGRHEYLSQSYLDLMGVTLEQVQQSGFWTNIQHPDDRQETDRLWHAALAERSFYTREYRVRAQDGTYHWVLCRGAAIIDDAGELQHWVGVNIDIDELKQVQEQLHAQRGFLHSIVDQMPSGVLVVEAGTSRVLLGNRTIEDIWGRDMNGVILRDFLATVEATGPRGRFRSAEDWPAIRALRGESVRNEIVRLEDGDKPRFISANASPVYGENAEIVVGLLTATDVTDYMQAQDELQHYRQRLETAVQDRTLALAERTRVLESVFNHSLCALALLDTEFNFIRVNQVYAEACARSLEDFAGHNYFQDYPAEELRAIFEEVVRTGQRHQEYSRPFLFPDHPEWDVTYWDLSVVPIPNADGKVELLLFSLQDVSEHLRAEAELEHRAGELAESERRYRELVENANSAIIRWTPDGKLIFTNEYADALFGYEPGELLGQSVTVLIAPTPLPDMTPQMLVESISQNPAAYERNENSNLTKDGRQLWIAWTNRSLFSPDGELAGIMAVGVDRTAEHEAQEKLRRLAAELVLAEHTERHRLATLLHDDLAQRLVFAKLRLQTAEATASLDEMRAAYTEASEVLTEAIQNTRHLTLELSAPVLYERGLAEALVWAAERAAAQYGYAQHTQLTGEVRRLQPEAEVTLFQAVEELLANVGRHAGATQVSLTLEYQPTAVLIEVADNGRGFTPQAASPTTQSPFGLRNVQERLAYLGGTFTLDTAPGQGTRVKLFCPA